VNTQDSGRHLYDSIWLWRNYYVLWGFEPHRLCDTVAGYKCEYRLFVTRPTFEIELSQSCRLLWLYGRFTDRFTVYRRYTVIVWARLNAEMIYDYFWKPRYSLPAQVVVRYSAHAPTTFATPRLRTGFRPKYSQPTRTLVIL